MSQLSPDARYVLRVARAELVAAAAPGATSLLPLAASRCRPGELLAGAARVGPESAGPAGVAVVGLGGIGAGQASDLLAQAPPAPVQVALALQPAGRGGRPAVVGLAHDGLTRRGGAAAAVGLVVVGVASVQATRAAGESSPAVDAVPDRSSRQAGGLGLRAWAALRASTVGVVGCGRTGSLVAAGLARSGVRALVLVDPDRVEAHNLDAMDGVGPDVGRPKVLALASWARSVAPDLEVHPVAESVSSSAALAALVGVDLLVCCTDDDGARWAAGALAAIYLRPLLDIGAGIIGEGMIRRMGADVRLLAPGERCILCAVWPITRIRDRRSTEFALS